MSWHTSGVLIQVETAEEDFPAFLETLGVEDAEAAGKKSFNDAIGEGQVAIACVEGWTSVWGDLLIVDDKTMKKLTKKTNAFSFLLEGSTGSAMFEWWVNGVRKRKRFIQEGEIIIDEGKPLPEEKGVIGDQKTDDEDQLFALMDKMTIPFRKLSKPKYNVFLVEDIFSSPLDDDD